MKEGAVAGGKRPPYSWFLSPTRKAHHYAESEQVRHLLTEFGQRVRNADRTTTIMKQIEYNGKVVRFAGYRLMSRWKDMERTTAHILATETEDVRLPALLRQWHDEYAEWLAMHERTIALVHEKEAWWRQSAEAWERERMELVTYQRKSRVMIDHMRARMGAVEKALANHEYVTQGEFATWKRGRLARMKR